MENPTCKIHQEVMIENGFERGYRVWKCEKCREELKVKEHKIVAPLQTILILSVIFLSILFIMGSVSATTWNSSFNDGLQYYWGFDETSGTVAYSNITNNSLTINNSLMWNATGKNLGCLRLVSAGWSAIGGGLNYSSNTTNYTISYWFKNDVSTAGYTGMYIGNSILNSPTTSGDFYSMVGGATDKLEIRFSGSTGGSTFPTAYNIGSWNHLVWVVRNGQVTRYFQNGVQLINSSTTTFTGFSSAPFRVFVTPASTTPFSKNISIDEIGVWNRSLSNSEVSDLYNSGAGIFYTPDSGLIVNNIIPINDSNITTSSITFSCNAVGIGITNITSITLNITNGSTLNWTQTISGLNNRSYNATFTNTTIPNGNYNWNCIGTGDTANSTSPIWTFGRLITQVNYVTPPTPISGYASSGNFTVTVDVTEVNSPFSNVTFWLFNSTYGLVNESFAFLQIIPDEYYCLNNSDDIDTNVTNCQLGADGNWSTRLNVMGGGGLGGQEHIIVNYTNVPSTDIYWTGTFNANIYFANSNSYWNYTLNNWQDIGGCTNDTLPAPPCNHTILIPADGKVGNKVQLRLTSGYNALFESQSFYEGFLSSLQINSFTQTYYNLSNGIYFFNVTAIDTSNIQNTTETRNITIDTINPNATLISPPNNSLVINVIQNFTVNMSDNFGIKNATLNIWNVNNIYSLCYQEFANVSTACGGLDTGVYEGNLGNWMDGDLNTYTTIESLLNWYVNYSKPIGALNTSLWNSFRRRTADNLTINYTIPSDCWNAYTDTLVFYMNTSKDGSFNTQAGYCFNGTDYNRLYNDKDWYGLWEEAMIWNISNPTRLANQTTTTFALGVTQSVFGIPVTLVAGTYNWFYTLFDWAGNTYTTENNTLVVVVPFSATWNTSKTESGSSNASQIRLPIYNGGVYNFTVYWGDGTSDNVTAWNDTGNNHTYSSQGTYRINITGIITGFKFNNTASRDKLKLINVYTWGALNLGNDGAYFYGCTNLNSTGTITDSLNLTGTTNLTNMFYSATSFNGNISSWDTSQVTLMNNMFYSASLFNQNLTNWNIGLVTNMSYMFSGLIFNQSLGNWDTSNVTDMSYMFNNNRVFNQNITSWNTSKVIDTRFMFSDALKFNQDIGAWNVSSVTNMSNMFSTNIGSSYIMSFSKNLSNWDTRNVITMSRLFYGGADTNLFNGNVSNWDTSNVTDMKEMFAGSRFNYPLNNWNTSNVIIMYSMFSGTGGISNPFNQNISSWNTSKTTDMSYMFYNNQVFNQNLNNWDTSQVITMYRMFSTARTFNGNISNWNTSKVTTMREMFNDARVFNQPISDWDTSKVTTMQDMFSHTSSSTFNQNLSNWNISAVTTISGFMAGTVKLSTANYDSLLLGWSSRKVTASLSTSFGLSTYSNCTNPNVITGVLGRNNLTNSSNLWTITDSGQNATFICPTFIINNTIPIVNYTVKNSSAIYTSITFNCNLTSSSSTTMPNITSVILNVTGTSTWTENISGMNDKSYNASFINTTIISGSYRWNCIGYGDIVNASSPIWLFNIDAENPNATLLTPVNGSYIVAASQNFTINLTDDRGIKNGTLYLYNETGLYNQTTTNFIFGTTQAVIGIPITLVAGTYNWFYKLFDWVDNSNTTGNNTLTIINPCTSAVGGTITVDGNYCIHTFLNNGTFNTTKTINATVLVVAGGGGGGGGYEGAGGGAGEIQYAINLTISSLNATVVVGLGGLGGTANNAGKNGSNSSFGNIIAIGGGGGGTSSIKGAVGGSGGGSSRAVTGGLSINSSSEGAISYGSSGGNGPGAGGTTGGGGGGAGVNGTNAISSSIGGPGGNGLSFTINGSLNYYAGGGGGSSNTGTPAGGLGGGGTGGNVGTRPTAGINGTGGGGGGERQQVAGVPGGSGIVIVRYLSDVVINMTIVNSIPAENSTITTSSTTFGCNATGILINITSIVLNVTGVTNWTQTIDGLNNESYNATFTNTTVTDGNYSWNCIAYGAGYNNISSPIWSFFKNSVPLITYISPPTPENEANISVNNFNVSVNVAGGNLANVTFYLFNSTGNLINESNGTSVSDNHSIAYINLIDDKYHYNVTVKNLANNENTTETRNITIDTTSPIINIIYPLGIFYNSNVSELNYTINDIHTSFCWNSLNLGVTNSTPVVCGINWTDLISNEGSNTWKVYANDIFGNQNVATVTFTKDTTNPLINFTTPTPASGSSISTSFTVTVNVTEINLVNVTFRLFNSTIDLINESLGTVNITYSSLPSGIYFFNVTALDLVGNQNSTETRNITIDTVYPTFTNKYDDTGNLTNSGTGHFNITVEDTNGTVILNINSQTVRATNLTNKIYNASYTFTNNGTFPYTWTSYGNGSAHNLNTSATYSYLVGNVSINLISPENASVLLRTNNTYLNISLSGDTTHNWTVTFYNASNSSVNTTLGIVNDVTTTFGAVIGLTNLVYGELFKWFVSITDGTTTVVSDIFQFTPNNEPNLLNLRIVNINLTSIQVFWENEPDMEWVAFRIGNDIVEVRSITSIADNWTVTGLFPNQQYELEYQTGDTFHAISDYHGFNFRTLGWYPGYADYPYRILITTNSTAIGTDKNNYAVNVSLNEDNFQYFDGNNWVYYPAFLHLNYTTLNNIRFIDYYDITVLPYNVTYINIPGIGGLSYQTIPNSNYSTGDVITGVSIIDVEKAHDGIWSTNAVPNSTGSLYYNYTIPVGAKTTSMFRISDSGWGWDIQVPIECYGLAGTDLAFRSDLNRTGIGAGYVITYCQNHVYGNWSLVRNNTDDGPYFFETMMSWQYDSQVNINVIPQHFDDASQDNVPGIDGNYDVQFWMYYGDADALNNESLLSYAGLDNNTMTYSEEINQLFVAPTIYNLNDTEGRTATGTNISWSVNQITNNRLRIATNPYLLETYFYSYITNTTQQETSLIGNQEHVILTSTSPSEYINMTNVVCSNLSYCSTTYNSCYQETADVSTACGGFNTGNYLFSFMWFNPDNAKDGNWTSYAEGDGVSFFVNYTKPIGVLNSSLWRVKDNASEANLTIPASCWNYNLTTLSFKIEVVSGPGPTQWSCFNSSWILLKNEFAVYQVYEEAMIWNISSDSTYYTVNSTADPVTITIANLGTTEFLNWNFTYEENKTWERQTAAVVWPVMNLITNVQYWYEAIAYGTNGNGVAEGNFILGVLPTTPTISILNYSEYRPTKTVTICANLTDMNGNAEINVSFQYWNQTDTSFRNTSSTSVNVIGYVCKDITVEFGEVNNYRAKAVGSTTGYSTNYTNEVMPVQEFFAGNTVEDNNDAPLYRQYCPPKIDGTVNLTGTCYEQKGYREGSLQEQIYMYIETNISTDVLTTHLLYMNGTTVSNTVMTVSGYGFEYLTINNLGQNWYTFYITNSTNDVILNWTKPGLTHERNKDRVDNSKYVSFNGTSSPFDYTLMYFNNPGVYNTSSYQWCQAAPGGNLFDCMSVQYWGTTGMAPSLSGTAFDRGQFFRGGVTNGEEKDSGLLNYNKSTTAPLGDYRQCFAFTVFYLDESKIPSNNITNYHYVYWTETQHFSEFNGKVEPSIFHATYLFEFVYDTLTFTRDWKEFSGTNSQNQTIVKNASKTIFNSSYNQTLVIGSQEGFNVELKNDNQYNFGLYTDGNWVNQQIGKYQQGYIIFNLPDNATLAVLDSDSDGLNDFDEVYTYYTNPKSNDTDEDGMLDNNEITNGYDPLLYTSHTASNITLLIPLNNTNTNADPIFFSGLIETFTPSGIKLVNLYINNILNDTFNVAADTTSVIVGFVKILHDGAYSWFYEAEDNTGVKGNSTIFNLTVDRVLPSVNYSSPTTPDYSNLSIRDIIINVSIYDINSMNVTIRILNSTFSEINASSWYDVTSNDFWINYTTSYDGIFYFSAEAIDTAGNFYSTTPRTVTIDTVSPNATLISPLNNTLTNITSQNYTVNLTDNFGIKNTTLFIYNSTQLVNITNINFSPDMLNTTLGVVVNLTDDSYKWFYQVYDWSGNSYITENYTIIIDTAYPIINYTNPTINNTGIQNSTAIWANMTAIDTSLVQISSTLELIYGPAPYTTNTTSKVATTAFDSLYYNWTGLSQGIYRISGYALDGAGLKTYIENRTVNIDNAPPMINYTYPTPTNGEDIAYNSFTINVTAVDANLANLTIYYWSANGTVHQQTTTSATNTLYQSGLSDGLYYYNASAYDTQLRVSWLPTALANNVNVQHTNITLSSCKELLIPYANYIVQADISSLTTCLNVTAPGITVYCQGHMITGNDAILANKVGLTLRNCIVTSPNQAALKVKGTSPAFVYIYNSTFTGSAYGIYVAPEAGIYADTITVTNNNYGIYFNYSNNGNSMKNVIMSGNSHDSITFKNSSYNAIANLLISSGLDANSNGLINLNVSTDNYIDGCTVTPTIPGSIIFGLYDYSINNKLFSCYYTPGDTIDATSQLIRSWPFLGTVVDKVLNKLQNARIIFRALHETNPTNLNITYKYTGANISYTGYLSGEMYTNANGQAYTNITEYMNIFGTNYPSTPYYFNASFASFAPDTELLNMNDSAISRAHRFVLGDEIASTQVSRTAMWLLLGLIFLIGIAASIGFYIVRTRDGYSIIDTYKYLIILIIWITMFTLMYIALAMFIMASYYPQVSPV